MKIVFIRKIDKSRFLKAWIIWLVGVLINFSPFVLKYLNSFLHGELLPNLFNYIFRDPDTIFAYFSLSFIINLEFWLDKYNYTKIKRAIGILTTLYSILALLIYAIILFSDGWDIYVSDKMTSSINFILFIAIFFIGFFSSVFLAYNNRKKNHKKIGVLFMAIILIFVLVALSFSIILLCIFHYLELKKTVSVNSLDYDFPEDDSDIFQTSEIRLRGSVRLFQNRIKYMDELYIREKHITFP